MFRNRFWITLLLTIPAVVWSEMVQDWLGFGAPAFPGSRLLPAVFGTAVYLYGGWVFVAGAVRELRHQLPGMMTLIALAISVAFFFSVAVTLGYPGDALWWELATLVTIMLLGHWLEMRPGERRAPRAREAPAQHGAAARRRTDRGGPHLGARGRRRRAGASRGERPGRRGRPGGEERRERVHAHR
jgi:Cu2+-exporting ATPase